MNQVFISNDRSGFILDNEPWADMAYTTGTADGSTTGMLGVWDPYGQTFLDGSTAALGLLNANNAMGLVAVDEGWVDANLPATALEADTVDVAANQQIINVVSASPQWLNHTFQFVQALPSGNPICSPIITSGQVKRMRWDPNNPPVAHVITCADAGMTSVAVGDTISFVVSCKFQGAIEFYEAQVNPGGSVTSVTPAISAAFDNPQRVYRFDYTAVSAVVATEVNAAVDALIADTDHPINSLATVTEVANDLVLTAKFFGQILKANLLKNGENVQSHAETTPPEFGVGSYAEVLSAEKKAQYSQGFFNRMYLPLGGTTLASTTPGAATATQTANYDRLVIEYVNKNAGMPGFNSAGNTSTATIYVPANGDHTTVAEGAAIESLFALQAGPTTAIEYKW